MFVKLIFLSKPQKLVELGVTFAYGGMCILKAHHGGHLINFGDTQ